MSQSIESTHPVLLAAFNYADKNTKVGDKATYDKAWTVKVDEFLIMAGVGLFQLIREMSQQQTDKAPYDLEEAYRLLLLIRSSIGGLTGTLVDVLVSSGTASSKIEANLYLTQAEFYLERTRNVESSEKVVPMIGIVGAISSGKGTIGDQLRATYGGIHLPLSDRLREVSLALGGDNTFPRTVLRTVNDALKPVYGNDVFVRWTIDIAQRQAQRHNYPVVSMDGFRSLEEAQTFKNAGGILIGVTASQQTRFNRLVARGRFGDDGWDSFLQSDAIESEWIDPILEICDYSIDNNGNEGELLGQVNAVINQLGLAK
ncbi:hypothetical protein KBD71_03285 [Candidatus Woesebacteria bacterium]|nr:hypothetical protein [Candidatus Woesebacteria bacterium]